jgi:hypothetical protein
LRAEQAHVGKFGKEHPPLPDIHRVKAAAREAPKELVPESPEFGQVIRKLVMHIVVYPVRLLDGGHIESRAKFTLNLAPLVDPDSCYDLMVDLFDPPQREQIRVKLMALLEDPKADHRQRQERQFWLG